MSAAVEEALPWRVPAALAVTQVVHWGSLYYAFSVLMPAIIAETGWRRELVVGAFSAGLLAEAAAAVLAGFLLDRLGARTVMVTGSLAAAFGLVLAGQVQTPAQLYAAWILIGATMAATLYQSAFAAVTAAFGAGAARRGIAAVAFAGGLASTVFWPLTNLLVEALGWRQTCAALAILNLACAALHLLMPGRVVPQREEASLPDQGSALDTIASRRFLALLLLYGATGFASATVAVHLVPLLQEKGLGASAAILASLVGVSQVLGRVAEFAGGGRLTLLTVTSLALVGVGGAFVMMGLGDGILLLGLAVALFGAANGILTIMRGALPAHLFGAARYGTVSGVLSAAGALARAAGPLAMAWAWERSGGYGPGMVAVALLLFAAILALKLATMPAGPSQGRV
ncbi:MFS transporter [Sabulicella glaciei]|uniref:MFS transporter n=1 Tax=Sabulicella glaciei TaxID=2984948 RepID=A0ABT3NZF9_9PROT|nr:MFS transporter [Roseococcus sp. MDT2-1-1]